MPFTAGHLPTNTVRWLVTSWSRHLLLIGSKSESKHVVLVVRDHHHAPHSLFTIPPYHHTTIPPYHHTTIPPPPRSSGGDADEEERALLPTVTAASRAATAARFDALSLDEGEDGNERASVLGFDLPGRRVDSRQMSPLERVTSSYLTNEGVYLHLRDYERRCGEISRVVRIGTSVEGVPIEALEISSTVEDGVKDGKPHVKLVATIHGDETSGLSTSLGVAEWLCANYETDPEARRVVQGVHLWVVPVMNPDGYKARTRYNANGIDLNRSFPDQFKGGMCMCPEGREPETQAIMELTHKYPFAGSLVFHEGDLVVNYPLDGTPNGQRHYSASADDRTFVYLARVYADNHPVLSTMRKRGFTNGITNGAGIEGATVSIKGIDHPFSTRDGGYFVRPLVPGKYTAVVEKRGYKTVEKVVTVKAGDAPELNVVLEKNQKKKKQTSPSPSSSSSKKDKKKDKKKGAKKGKKSTKKQSKA